MIQNMTVFKKMIMQVTRLFKFDKKEKEGLAQEGKKDKKFPTKMNQLKIPKKFKEIERDLKIELTMMVLLQPLKKKELQLIKKL
jgi:hypothetical protein